MTKAEYAVYLRSPHWQRMREAALRRAAYRCQVCNGGKDLHVHHRTYERCPGEERAADLTVLCADCHARYHDKVRTPGGTPGRKTGRKLSKNQRRRKRDREARALTQGSLAESMAAMKERNASRALDAELDAAVGRDSA